LTMKYEMRWYRPGQCPARCGRCSTTTVCCVAGGGGPWGAWVCVWFPRGLCGVFWVRAEGREWAGRRHGRRPACRPVRTCRRPHWSAASSRGRCAS
jgi:hypothetical protein